MEETPKKPAPGKTDFAKLIEVMESNNKSTTKIEIDGRNTRRHLLEMKNMQKVMNDFQARTVFGFENFQDMIDSQRLQGMEDSSERMGIFQEIRDELRNLPKQTGKETAQQTANNKDGISSKIGGILQGVGIAAAGIGFGIAAVISQAPKLIETFENMDVDKIGSQVTKLLAINEQAGGNAQLLKDGGSLALALGGIGFGLAAMSIGTGVAAAVDKFSGPDFVSKIKDNVEGLLAINDLPGAGLGEGGTAAFVATMTGLGIGLAAFAIGKAGAGVADGITAFTSGDNFADTIVKEVGTLLTIPNLPGAKLGEGGLATFVATMTGLGLGLVAFAIGKSASGAADALTTFQGENFAQDIKDEVETLLSITNLPGAGLGEGGTAKFIATMSGLGLGLVAFSAGKAGAGVADAFTKFTAGDNFAEDIKKEVATLLQIGDGASLERTGKATGALTALGLGLAAFAGGKGANALANLGSSIVNFLTGSKNPVDQAIELGKNHATVQKGADAFQDFADALNSFSNVNLDFDAKDFAEQLFNAAQTLQLAFEGGTTGGFLGFGETELVGITNMQADMDAAVDTITKLRGSLDMSTATVSMSAPSPIEGMVVNTLSVENAILKIPEASSGGNTTIAQRGGDTVKGGDTILITNNTNQVTDSLQVDR
jgi:hypothetical protein